jgi:hypothetical protein
MSIEKRMSVREESILVWLSISAGEARLDMMTSI